MANLLSACELAWKQLWPNPSDETPVTKEEFIETGKLEYANNIWLLSKNEKQQEGVFNVPSILLSEDELPVVDNEVDISGLKILRSLTNDSWLQHIGELTCECNYVKSNVNQQQLLCDENDLGDDYKPYLVVGNKIKFPQGTHKNPISIIYANSGYKVGEKIDIDDAIAAIIRTRLVEIYGGRTGVPDVTNNTNPGN